MNKSAEKPRQICGKQLDSASTIELPGSRPTSIGSIEYRRPLP
jgi:hypothetical protein